MSKRLAVFRASSVVVLAIACGCALPTTKKGATEAPGADQMIAGGGLAPGKGATGAPFHGLISNNSGGLFGTVRGPSASLIANNAAGLISNNSGGLISNNSGGLISNNSGGLISNNSGGYRVAQSDTRIIPYVKATITVYDATGAAVHTEVVTTDASGNFQLKKVKDSSALVYVQADYEIDGQEVSLLAAASAPRKADVQVLLNPATTFVGKKLREMTTSNMVSATTITPATISQLSDKVASVMGERAAVAAVIFDGHKAAQTFDNMVKESQDFQDALQKIITNNKAGNILAATKPAPTGVATATPKAGTSTKPTTAPTATPSTNATATPSTPPANPPKATVFTLGQAPAGSALAFSGTTLYAGHGGGVDKATVSGATSTVNFASEGTDAAKAVVFDGADKYVLGATTISKNGTAVTLQNVTSPVDFAVSGGFAYVVSGTRHVIYKVDLATGASTVLAGQDGTGVYADGKGTAAGFKTLTGITLMGGALYVSDSGNQSIRKVTLDGDVTTYAGASNAPGTVDGTGAAAKFTYPGDVTTDGAGNLYVVDTSNNNVRKIAAGGVVTTLAGSGTNKTQDGVGAAASFSLPSTITFGKAGTASAIFVGQGNGSVRVLTDW
jgi:aspartate/glutamate racemase